MENSKVKIQNSKTFNERCETINGRRC